MSSKQKSNLALTTTSVPEVINQLNARIESMKHIQDSVYKTTGKLDGFGDIKTETIISNLIRAYSVVLAKAAAYANAAEDLGLTTYPAFSIAGSSVEDWKADILLRKAIIEQKETLDKLVSFRDKMSKFLSEEDQKTILLKEMQDFLSQ